MFLSQIDLCIHIEIPGSILRIAPE